MLPLIISLEKLKERRWEESCRAFLFLYVTNNQSPLSCQIPNDQFMSYFATKTQVMLIFYSKA